MATWREVAEYRAANVELSDMLEADLLALWATLDLSRPDAAKAVLLAEIPALTELYGTAAATVAADWYDEIRASEGVPGRFRAVLADPFPAEWVQARVGFGLGHLFTSTPEKLLPFLEGAVQEYGMQPGRDTVQRSSIEDPQASGWHRETRADACKFCRMLAGRGGVYRKATVSFAAHGKCHCVGVASWDPDAPEVPTSAYVASQSTSTMSPAQKRRHNERIRSYLAGMAD